MFWSPHSQVGGLERQVDSFPSWEGMRCRFEPHSLRPGGGEALSGNSFPRLCVLLRTCDLRCFTASLRMVGFSSVVETPAHGRNSDPEKPGCNAPYLKFWQQNLLPSKRKWASIHVLFYFQITCTLCTCIGRPGEARRKVLDLGPQVVLYGSWELNVGPLDVQASLIPLSR